MFQVNLVDLDRKGAQSVHGRIPSDSDLWSDVEAVPLGDLDVAMEVSTTATGQVVARGRVVGESRHECRRCLDKVAEPLDLDLVLVWSAPEDLDEDGEDPDLRVLDPSTNELDLAPAIREEALLAMPRFVLCKEDCRGLCPQCGINRNTDTCDCTLEESDPRWDALRSLQNE